MYKALSSRTGHVKNPRIDKHCARVKQEGRNLKVILKVEGRVEVMTMTGEVRLVSAPGPESGVGNVDERSPHDLDEHCSSTPHAQHESAQHGHAQQGHAQQAHATGSACARGAHARTTRVCIPPAAQTGTGAGSHKVRANGVHDVDQPWHVDDKLPIVHAARARRRAQRGHTERWPGLACPADQSHRGGDHKWSLRDPPIGRGEMRPRRKYTTSTV